MPASTEEKPSSSPASDAKKKLDSDAQKAAKAGANKAKAKLAEIDMPSMTGDPKANPKTPKKDGAKKEVAKASAAPAAEEEWWPKPKTKPIIDPPRNTWFSDRADEIYVTHMFGAVTCAYLFGRFGLGFLPAFAMMAPAYYLIKKSRSYEKKYAFHREVTDAKLWEKPEFVEKILHEIPPWVRTPDWEKGEWMQKMMTQMWPYIRKCADQGVRENVDPILKDSCPGFLKSITIGSMNMGSREPEILGLQNTALKNGNRTILDIKLIIHKMSIDLNLETPVGTQFTAGIRDLTIQGTFRVVLWPLIDYIPLIGGVRLGFAKRPQINLQVQTAGLGVNIPGLDDYLNNLVEDTIVGYFCYPNDYFMPMLLEKDLPDAYEPKGMLRIMVKEGRGLQEKSGGFKKLLKGTIDPYVEIGVHGMSKKTRAKDNTANPKWHQVLEFILRSEPEDAELDITVWDKDLGKDAVVSRATIELKDWVLKDSDGKQVNKWVKMDNGPGELLLGMVWKPYYKNITEMQKSHGASPAQAKGLSPQQQLQAVQGDSGTISRTGLLMLTVRAGRSLRIADGNSSDPFVSLKMVETSPSKPQKFKTTIKFKTLEPSWDEEFQFTINNSESDKIKMIVYDYDKMSTNDFLGECELKISTLIENLCEFDDWLTLQGVKTGSLQVKAKFYPN